jgi:hypothetical protein
MHGLQRTIVLRYARRCIYIYILFFTLSVQCLRFIHVGYGYREIIKQNSPVCTFISIRRFVSLKILKIKQTNDGALCRLAYN